ncbi:MAG: hypothetical protein WCS94_03735 [Verrucomicrobiota bacterium]
MWNCPRCNQQIEDTFDFCWKCDDATLPKQKDTVSPTRLPTPFKQDSGAQEPTEFIEEVRSRSCYGALRTLINILSVLSIILIIISGLGLVIAGDWVFLYEVIIGAIIITGWFLVIAGRQAVFLLIDIADTLIEQSRKKK